MIKRLTVWTAGRDLSVPRSTLALMYRLISDSVKRTHRPETTAVNLPASRSVRSLLLDTLRILAVSTVVYNRCTFR